MEKNETGKVGTYLCLLFKFSWEERLRSPAASDSVGGGVCRDRSGWVEVRFFNLPVFG